ncbi:hypothetical protein FHR84_002266 [Actinopolyspora biskrensis]|uniref:DUF2690 domain-containing protein n=1 Tax=Actinopolyspora biskrensis TaxID=1470178 RepID=A0A852YWC4_9ACTN|nr:DUF2690 domain-containing protein [Actinopolyspora biskrensis]NYH78941.1 hypothetical protein [Actinopolyspora biskrensis]
MATPRRGGWTPLDPEVPPYTRALTERLRESCLRAGRPSFRQLRMRSTSSGGVTLTLATLSRVFTPDPSATDQRSLPEWVYYETLLELLGVDAAPFRELWERAQREWRLREKATPEAPAEPCTADVPESRAEPSGVAGSSGSPRARESGADVAPAAAGEDPEGAPGGGVGLEEDSAESDEVAPVERLPESPARGKTLRYSFRPAILLVLVLLFGGGAGVLAVLPDERSLPERAEESVRDSRRTSAVTRQSDGSSPYETECADPTRVRVFYSHLYRDWPRQNEPTTAVVRLHYSPTCRTVWAVLEDAAPGSVATLRRESDGAELSCTAGANGSCITPQLDDAGHRSFAEAHGDGTYARTRSF